MDQTSSSTSKPKKSLSATVLFSLVGFLLFGFLIIWLQSVTQPPSPEADRAVERRAILAGTLARETAAASDILWVDKEAGLVSVPPKMFETQVLTELAAKPVRPSAVPVDPLAAIAPSSSADASPPGGGIVPNQNATDSAPTPEQR